MPMGAHIVRPARTGTPAPTLILALALVISFVAVSFGASDAELLLKFKSSLGNASALEDWNLSRNPCTVNYANWVGVLCLKGSIWGLKLENMGLSGAIDIDSLSAIPSIRTISLMNNKFEGPLPIINKLGSLKALYLSNNYFSGKIPDDAFQGMKSLKKLYMANNQFTGSIPLSLVELPKIQELRLETNQFEGSIPEFKQDTLKSLDLANNQLEGPIPSSLSHMDASVFSGNKHLCGPPLDTCEIPSQRNVSTENNNNNPTQQDVGQQNVVKENSNQKKEISIMKIVLILIVVGFLLGIIAVALIIFYMRNRTSQTHRTSLDDSSTACTNNIQYKTQEIDENKKKLDYGKLSFVREDIEKFDLQDMLRASAEVLGSGTFGASYKTVIASGQAYVVKRYKQMNSVGREDFHEHMRRLGRLMHPNLLPLTAFYYRKEEKLLVYEFVQNGSLASKLHANHSAQRPGLDWRTRLKIIKGVAKGMGYLHTELPSTVLPHGHLKSSNVLLDKSFEPLLTDYALRPVINPDNAHTLMVAYKSPEYASLGKISKKADVWCLGILILELLTGKFPENYLLQGYSSQASLSNWINNMVKEKRTSEVFDKEMKGAKDNKSEMINLLKIGLSCCEEDVQTRLDMKEVVDKILQLKEGDHINEDHLNEGYARSFNGNDGGFSMKYG